MWYQFSGHPEVKMLPVHYHYLGLLSVCLLVPVEFLYPGDE